MQRSLHLAMALSAVLAVGACTQQGNGSSSSGGSNNGGGSSGGGGGSSSGGFESSSATSQQGGSGGSSGVSSGGGSSSASTDSIDVPVITRTACEPDAFPSSSGSSSSVESSSSSETTSSSTTASSGTSGGGCVEDSYEPNDVAADAKTLTLTGATTTFDNLQSCNGGHDWFKFKVPGGNGVRVTIDFHHSDADLDLLLYRASDTDSDLSASEGVTDQEVVEKSFFAAETDVLVHVKNIMTGSAPYSMKVEVAPGECAEDFEEPNDTADEATDVGHISGSLTLCGANPDYISFVVPPGVVTKVQVLYAAGAPALNGVVFAEGTENVTVATLGVYNATLGGQEAQFTAETAGTYMLKVNIAGGGGATDYDVKLVFAAPANDTCAAATELTLPAEVHASTLGAANDVENVTNSCTGYYNEGGEVFYRVTIPAGRVLRATVEAERDLSLYLIESCESRCCWGGTDDAIGGELEVLRYMNGTSANQTLFLGVDGFNQNAVGNFTLNVMLE